MGAIGTRNIEQLQQTAAPESKENKQYTFKSSTWPTSQGNWRNNAPAATSNLATLFCKDWVQIGWPSSHDVAHGHIVTLVASCWGALRIRQNSFDLWIDGTLSARKHYWSAAKSNVFGKNKSGQQPSCRRSRFWNVRRGGSNIDASGPLLLQTASFQVADCQTRLQWRQLRRAHKRLDRRDLCHQAHKISTAGQKPSHFPTYSLSSSMRVQSRRHQRRITVTNVIVSLPPPPPGSWA